MVARQQVSRSAVNHASWSPADAPMANCAPEPFYDWLDRQGDLHRELLLLNNDIKEMT